MEWLLARPDIQVNAAKLNKQSPLWLAAAMIFTYTCRRLNESQPNLFRGTDSREDTAAVPRVAVEAVNVYGPLTVKCFSMCGDLCRERKIHQYRERRMPVQLLAGRGYDTVWCS